MRAGRRPLVWSTEGTTSENEIRCEIRLERDPERRGPGRLRGVPMREGTPAAVLDAVQSLRGPSDLLFPSPMRSGRPLSDMALTTCLRDIRLADRTVVHGIRRSFRTWASERISVPPAVAEMALVHQVGSAVERSYARSDLFEKRRQLMDQWAALTGGSAKVLRLPPVRDTARGRSAPRFIRRFASTVDSVAVGTWESSNPRFDLAFRPSNGRPTNPVRLRKFAGAHHPVDGGPTQTSAPLNLGASPQSVLWNVQHINNPFLYRASPESRHIRSMTFRVVGVRASATGTRGTSGPSRHTLRTRTWVTARNHRRITAPQTRTFNHGAALGSHRRLIARLASAWLKRSSETGSILSFFAAAGFLRIRSLR